jgi:hypothetical protein
MINFIPLTFFGLIAVVGISFFVHGFANRQKIFAFFRDLSSNLGGEAGRDHMAAYPWLKGRFEDRDVRIFFHTSENHTVSVLNLVTQMQTTTPLRFVLLQKDGFRKPKPDQLQKLEEEVGPLVPAEGLPFDVRSPDGGAVSPVLSDPGFRQALKELDGYNQILFWDGQVIASRQFAGVPETEPKRMLALLDTLSRLVRPAEAEATVGAR